jgi:hypothetical protein
MKPLQLISSLFSRSDRPREFSQSRQFTPLEEQLLSALAGNLSEPARALLEGQVRAINRIQRLADSREVNCYATRWKRRLSGQVENRFPNQVEELLLATISFRTSANASVKAKFYVVNGYFFEILFNKGVRRVSAPVAITKVSIEADPMRPHEPRRERRSIPIEFPGWLGELARRHNAQNAYAPASPEVRGQLLADIDATLPSDYLSLLEQTDGLDFEACNVMGIEEIREVADSEGNLYLIAELNGHGVLAVREGSRDGSVVYVDFDKGQQMFSSLREACEAYFSGRLSQRGNG